MKLHSLLALSIPVALASMMMGCPHAETNTDPADLEAPPQGQGFQIETPEIAVAQGDEVQNCYFFKVSDLLKQGGIDASGNLNLNHVQIAQRTGSHHMNVFRVKTVVGLDPTKGTVEGKNGQGECFKSTNWADWPLVANSQEAGAIDWKFPDGVANVMGPDEFLMVQTHWVNASTQQTPESGKVRINFWHLPKEQVKYELGTIFATKQSIRVCQSNPTPEFSGSCQIKGDTPVTIIGANGHFHSRGKQFDIYTWDGKSIDTPPDSARFYRSDAWNEPPMLHSPDLTAQVPAGGGVFYTCSYQWHQPDPSIGCKGLDAFDQMKYKTPDDKLDCCYTFGPIVEKNEHCNAFVYYYPKQDDVNCQ
jgi:hypothetical protein